MKEGVNNFLWASAFVGRTRSLLCVGENAHSNIRLCLSTLLTTSQKKKKCWSEYYCCCLHYPLSPSLPLTERGLQARLGYFYFWRFLLLRGGSNSNWTSASGLARDRQVRARLQMVGGSLRGREKKKTRIKETGFPSMTALSPFLSSPQLSACLRSPSASLPGRQLFCLPDMINGIGQCGAARFGFTLQSQEVRRVPPCLLVGRWRVSWSSPQGHVRQIFFHRSALDCLLFFSACATHKKPPTEKKPNKKNLDWNRIS